MITKKGFFFLFAFFINISVQAQKLTLMDSMDIRADALLSIGQHHLVSVVKQKDCYELFLYKDQQSELLLKMDLDAQPLQMIWVDLSTVLCLDKDGGLKLYKIESQRLKMQELVFDTRKSQYQAVGNHWQPMPFGWDSLTKRLFLIVKKENTQLSLYDYKKDQTLFDLFLHQNVKNLNPYINSIHVNYLSDERKLILSLRFSHQIGIFDMDSGHSLLTLGQPLFAPADFSAYENADPTKDKVKIHLEHEVYQTPYYDKQNQLLYRIAFEALENTCDLDPTPVSQRKVRQVARANKKSGQFPACIPSSLQIGCMAGLARNKRPFLQIYDLKDAGKLVGQVEMPHDPDAFYNLIDGVLYRFVVSMTNEGAKYKVMRYALNFSS